VIERRTWRGGGLAAAKSWLRRPISRRSRSAGDNHAASVDAALNVIVAGLKSHLHADGLRALVVGEGNV
jgi:hypothetical protein